MSASWSIVITVLILVDVDPSVMQVIAGTLEVVVRHDGGLLLGAGEAGVGLVDDAVISSPSVVLTLHCSPLWRTYPESQ